jgi:hypothetical protein
METDEMRDGKSDRAAGTKAQSGDRMVIEMAIGWENGVVCHSVGLRAACSDEGVTRKMGLRAACSDEGFTRKMENGVGWFATQWVFVQPARMRASHGKWFFVQPARMRASHGKWFFVQPARMRASHGKWIGSNGDRIKW